MWRHFNQPETYPSQTGGADLPPLANSENNDQDQLSDERPNSSYGLDGLGGPSGDILTSGCQRHPPRSSDIYSDSSRLLSLSTFAPSSHEILRDGRPWYTGFRAAPIVQLDFRPIPEMDMSLLTEADHPESYHQTALQRSPADSYSICTTNSSEVPGPRNFDTDSQIDISGFEGVQHDDYQSLDRAASLAQTAHQESLNEKNFYNVPTSISPAKHTQLDCDWPCAYNMPLTPTSNALTYHAKLISPKSDSGLTSQVHQSGTQGETRKPAGLLKGATKQCFHECITKQFSKPVNASCVLSCENPKSNRFSASQIRSSRQKSNPGKPKGSRKNTASLHIVKVPGWTRNVTCGEIPVGKWKWNLDITLPDTSVHYLFGRPLQKGDLLYYSQLTAEPKPIGTHRDILYRKWREDNPSEALVYGVNAFRELQTDYSSGPISCTCVLQRSIGNPEDVRYCAEVPSEFTMTFHAARSLTE
uniref:Uncharacterized protein n=1 Tax=Kwoniella bestiolae CBS 10118 TaxID=1296100 RepID=A0A1B9FUF4_9TREE|nr:hypothetical protein I302_08048 [Kwoniella bestiolae CBS 10118]OCF22400.1 hypothetical protein I302_08048 [Kwoniella bestiolae CBS 10118]